MESNPRQLKTANGNLPRPQEEKQKMIEEAAIRYGQFLDALGFDWREDENTVKTPYRVAKAYIEDIISGCVTEPPNITDFPSDYEGMVFEGDIEVNSLCAHHHLPFIGKAYVAYLPNKGRQIGLSKMNRIVDWYSRRPQIQEGLTQQIHSHLEEVCKGNKGVAVMIECKHLCCSQRGIKHDSTMITSSLSGAFLDNSDKSKAEFLQFISYLKK